MAIDLTDDIREKAAEIINKMKSLDIDVKFVEPKNLHITMKFLGDVSEDRVNGIEDAISGAVKALKDSGSKPFKVSVEGLGYFGVPSHIKTLWVDTGEGHEELVKLVGAMNAALDHIRKDDRKPKPHITLGRVKSGRNREALLKMLEEMKHVKLGEMDVKLVKLKQSVLSKEGPHYSDLKSFEL